MAEYIEREKIYADISRLLIDKSTADLTNCEDGWTSAISEAMDVIKNAPAADVRPERHGRWVDYKHNTSAIQCTVCEHIFESAIFGYAYCPICGAKMDGDENAR